MAKNHTIKVKINPGKGLGRCNACAIENKQYSYHCINCPMNPRINVKPLMNKTK